MRLWYSQQRCRRATVPPSLAGIGVAIESLATYTASACCEDVQTLGSGVLVVTESASVGLNVTSLGFVMQAREPRRMAGVGVW